MSWKVLDHTADAGLEISAASCVFCKREILKVAKIFPQQGGGEFCHPSLRIRESLTRLLGPSNSSR